MYNFTFLRYESKLLRFAHDFDLVPCLQRVLDQRALLVFSLALTERPTFD